MGGSRFSLAARLISLATVFRRSDGVKGAASFAWTQMRRHW